MSSIASMSITLVIISLLIHIGSSTLDDCPDVNLQCSQSCSSINFCATKGGSPVEIRSCSTDDKRSCSRNSGVPRCDSRTCNQGLPKPICGVAGAIPSPYSCYSYFICARVGDENPTAVTCPDQQVFSASKKECWSGVCVDGPKICSKPEDTGLIDFYSRLYCYYCDDQFRPLIMLCKDLPIPLPPPTV